MTLPHEGRHSSSFLYTSSTAGAYDEELFYSLLQRVNVSRDRIERLTRLALRHLPQAAETWSACRRALVEQSELDSDKNRALWYVVDSLLKHAPHVFVPLAASRLVEYVKQQLPWYTVRWGSTSGTSTGNAGATHAGSNGEAGTASTTTAATAAQRNDDENGARRGAAATTGDGKVWCERLVLSWVNVLPASLFKPIQHIAVQCRSEAELDGALGAAAATGTGGGVKRPAGEHEEAAGEGTAVQQQQQRQLRDEWEAFRYYCISHTQQQQALAFRVEAEGTNSSIISKDTDSTTDRKNGTGVAGTGVASGTGGASRPNAKLGGSAGDVEDGEDDDDDDYCPLFVAGAKPRELPCNEPQQRKREARRRPREDDF